MLYSCNKNRRYFVTINNECKTTNYNENHLKKIVLNADMYGKTSQIVG